MLVMMYVVMICYLVVIVVMFYCIITTRKIDAPTIAPIEIKPERKNINSIIAASKSEFLKPPPPKPKPIPAQVPAEDVPNLFKEGMPKAEEPELEYDEDDLPEKDEVIVAEPQADDAETTRPMCMDYMQMDGAITRMVRGTASISDRGFIEQLEGTELFAQIQAAMTTTNLERVRTILNSI